MTRIAVIAACVLATLSLAGLGLKAVYQAGWDAREALAVEEYAAQQRATQEALQRASDTLAFELGKTIVRIETTEDKVKEIQDGQPEDPAVCGISLERMRLLEEIR